MGLLLLTPPTEEPIDAIEALEHARELDESQAAYLEGLIAAARVHAEDVTSRAFLTQTWTLTLDAFPAKSGCIDLPKPPLQSVTGIAYTAGDGTTATVDPAAYTVDTSGVVGRIVLNLGYVWPVTRVIASAVRVTFVAGYGDDPEDVPAPLRHAIKLLTSHWYEQREPVITGTIVTEVPFTLQSLLWPYRVRLF